MSDEIPAAIKWHPEVQRLRQELAEEGDRLRFHIARTNQDKLQDREKARKMFKDFDEQWEKHTKKKLEVCCRQIMAHMEAMRERAGPGF
jgi:nicotinamide mononucleotide adenylyltransferase